MPASGPEADARIQGGVLADGVNSLLACLATSLPNTTISQNNGIIALTRCASRRAGAPATSLQTPARPRLRPNRRGPRRRDVAGFCACAVLVAMGVASKLSATAAAVPDPVLGGLLTFCFANILVSGARILAPAAAARRGRFVAACALGAGAAVALVPAAVSNAQLQDSVPPAGAAPPARSVLRVSLQLLLATPYCVGTALAMLLHAILPLERDPAPRPDPRPARCQPALGAPSPRGAGDERVEGAGAGAGAGAAAAQLHGDECAV